MTMMNHTMNFNTIWTFRNLTSGEIESFRSYLREKDEIKKYISNANQL